MIQIWLLFKIIETMLGLICIIYHTMGFLNEEEPLPHIMLFCGTFFGFTLISLLTAASIVLGTTPPSFTEFIVNFLAFVLYILSSFVSMYYAENDDHLQYLSDLEEPDHAFFAYSRAQSIGALATAAIHLLHCIIAFEVLYHKEQELLESSESDTDTDEEEKKSASSIGTKNDIRMYFISKYMENKLRLNPWFNELCRRERSRSLIMRMKRDSKVLKQTRYSFQVDNEKRSSKNKKTSQKTLTTTPKEISSESELETKTFSKIESSEKKEKPRTSKEKRSSRRLDERQSARFALPQPETMPKDAQRPMQSGELSDAKPIKSPEAKEKYDLAEEKPYTEDMKESTNLPMPKDAQRPMQSGELSDAKPIKSPEAKEKHDLSEEKSYTEDMKESTNLPMSISDVIKQNKDSPQIKPEFSQTKGADSSEHEPSNAPKTKPTSSSLAKSRDSLPNAEKPEEELETESKYVTPTSSIYDTDKKDEEAEKKSKSKPGKG